MKLSTMNITISDYAHHLVEFFVEFQFSNVVSKQ